MSNGWRSECWRLCWVLLVCTLIALISGAWGVVYALGLALYSGYHLRQMYRFERWLSTGARKSQLPESRGAWEAIIGHVYRIQQNSRSRKTRLVAMLGRFNASTEALPDAAVVLRTNGDIDWANTAARHVLGIRNPQDIGQRIDNLLRSPDFRRYLSQADFSTSLEICSPVQPSIVLSVRVVAYGDGLRLLLAHDVTIAHRLQQIRRDFVANVSHELKTPLTVVLGYTEVLSQEQGLPVAVSKGLASVDQQARRMSRIVDDLLLLSKMELENPQEVEWVSVDVSRLLGSLREQALLLCGTTGHQIDLSVDDSVTIMGNPAELSSAFFNLIANAIQHTPAATHIDVVWEMHRGAARLLVRDDGPGIAAQHLPRLTERFYRVDAGRSRNSGGTGLGLAIVKHAVENNGGFLDVESVPGSGAVFICTFPLEHMQV